MKNVQKSCKVNTGNLCQETLKKVQESYKGKCGDMTEKRKNLARCTTILYLCMQGDPI